MTRTRHPKLKNIVTEINKFFRRSQRAKRAGVPDAVLSSGARSACMVERRGLSTRGPESAQASVAADDKTILMQVQNALQKQFAKDTPPGQKVWEWKYSFLAR